MSDYSGGSVMENIVDRTNYDIGWLLDNVNHNCRQIGLEQLDLDVMWKPILYYLDME